MERPELDIPELSREQRLSFAVNDILHEKSWDPDHPLIGLERREARTHLSHEVEVSVLQSRNTMVSEESITKLSLKN